MKTFGSEFRVVATTDAVRGRYPTGGLVSSQGTFIHGFRDWPRLAMVIGYSAPDYNNRFKVAWGFVSPIDVTHSAVFRLDGETLVADEPADCLGVVKMAEYDGDVYALGYRFVEDPTNVTAMTGAEYDVYDNGNLLPKIAVWYNADDTDNGVGYATAGVWFVPQPHITFCLWKRTSGGVWSIVFNPANEVEVVSNAAVDFDLLVAGTLLVFSFQEWRAAYDGVNGITTTSSGAHLLDNALGIWRQWYGYNGTKVDFLGFASAVLANSGGNNVRVVGATDFWRGPRGSGLAPMRTWSRSGAPVGLFSKPVLWRNRVWAIWSDSAVPTRVSLGYFDDTGAFTEVWSRATPDETTGPYRWTCVVNETGMLWCGGLGQKGATTQEGTAREWLIAFDGHTVASRLWSRRVFSVLSGTDAAFLLTLRWQANDSAVRESTELAYDRWGLLLHRVDASDTGNQLFAFELLRADWGFVVLQAGVEFADGSEAGDPVILSAGMAWRADIAHGSPAVASVGVEWSDGSGVAEPEITAVDVDWSDGSGSEEPEVNDASMDWAMVPLPENGAEPRVQSTQVEWGYARDLVAGERVLWITNTDASRSCFGLVVTSGLGPEVDAQCRLLVRTDSAEAVDNYASYEPGRLADLVMLQKPGSAVRVGIIGPDTLPIDTDFDIQFLR